MISCRMLIAATAVSLIAFSAMAQTANTDSEKNGHHYSGGPKTEVPHHMGRKETTGSNTKPKSDGGHHYSGGPKTESHHMGPKK